MMERDSFVYGGKDEDENYLPDTYVLSLPAFQWFKVNSLGGRRVFHECATAGNRQMIVVGGQLESESDSSERRDKDEWTWGLGVFDMHDMQWKDNYDPEAGPYESPAMIKDWYTNG